MNPDKKLSALFKTPAIWLGIVAAILYSSWPLGYLLNSNVAHNAYASQLEATNQPYSWLFIAFDVLSGLALVVAGILQWKRSKNLLIRLSIIGYLFFAILVIVAALIPFNCNSLSASCIDAVHSPLAIVHGLASVISVITLLISILLIAKLLSGEKTVYRLKLAPLFIILCWGLIGALAYTKYHHADENLVQYAFISVCSLSVLFSVVLIEHGYHLFDNETSGGGLEF